MFVIPYEIEYRNFLENHAKYNSGCSGVGSCDHCTKKSYPHRNKYLKNYLDVFFKNITTFKIFIQNKETLSMPKLEWCAAETAAWMKCGDFHTKYCNNNKTINECDCNLAIILLNLV